MDNSTQQKINWEPLARGGSNYRTRRLNMDKDDQWVYERTGISRIIPTFAIVLGAFIAIVLFFTIIFFFVGIAFIIVGFIVRKRQKRSIVFDFKKQAFWKGDKKLNTTDGSNQKVKDYLKFEDLVALQILSEEIYTEGSDNRNSKLRTNSIWYASYELNFILKNNTRVNVVDHADLKAIKREAEALSKRLSVPLLISEELK